MFSKVCIIGLGTLGGFIAKSLSELDNIVEVGIIDYDTIEEKNLKNSVYLDSHIDKYKIDALEEILKSNNKNIKVNKYNMKFVEGENDIHKQYDLVIDCRDFTYDRKEEIDARLYVTSRYVVIDCRKNIEYDSHREGTYITTLTKNDLRYASIQVAMMINNDSINDLISNQLVHNIDLDYLDKNISDALITSNKTPKVKTNNKLVNLDQKISTISKYNSLGDITVHLGERNHCSITITIPQNQINTIEDFMQLIKPMMNLPYTYNSYVVEANKINNNFYVELLPETGAA